MPWKSAFHTERAARVLQRTDAMVPAMTSDFVFNSVYRGAKHLGANERESHNQAIIASEKYRKNQYKKKPVDLIEDAIKTAVRLSKLTGKSS